DLPLGDHAGREIDDDRRAARHRRRRRDRVGREPPVGAAERGDQDAGAARVHPVERDEPGVGGHDRPVADAAEVAAVAERHRGERVPSGLPDARRHCLLADHLAEPELPVDHGHGVGLEDDPGGLVGAHHVLPEPVDIGRHADDAVGVMADQVGLHQVPRDGASLLVPAARPGEDRGDEPLDRFGLVGHLVPSSAPPSPASGAGPRRGRHYHGGAGTSGRHWERRGSWPRWPAASRMIEAAMGWEPEVEELKRRLELARLMGGPENVARQHKAGRLTVRERLERLPDPGSFHETGALAGAATYAAGELRAIRPANFVMGTGRIDGRRVVVGGDDFTVRGGANDASIGGKQVYGERMARELRLPLVRLVEGTGGGGSVKTLDTLGRTYVPGNPGWDLIAAALAEIPVVAAALGPV